MVSSSHFPLTIRIFLLFENCSLVMSHFLIPMHLRICSGTHDYKLAYSYTVEMKRVIRESTSCGTGR